MHSINKKKFFGAGCNSLPAVIVREPYKTVELVQFQYRQYSLDERRKKLFLLNFHEDTPYRVSFFEMHEEFPFMKNVHEKENKNESGSSCKQANSSNRKQVETKNYGADSHVVSRIGSAHDV